MGHPVRGLVRLFSLQPDWDNMENKEGWLVSKINKERTIGVEKEDGMSVRWRKWKVKDKAKSTSGSKTLSSLVFLGHTACSHILHPLNPHIMCVDKE